MIRAANCSDEFETTGDTMMADFAALTPGPGLDIFLDEQDMIELRQAADDIDAAYGELLDTLVPETLVRIAATSCAA